MKKLTRLNFAAPPVLCTVHQWLPDTSPLPSPGDLPGSVNSIKVEGWAPLEGVLCGWLALGSIEFSSLGKFRGLCAVTGERGLGAPD